MDCADVVAAGVKELHGQAHFMLGTDAYVIHFKPLEIQRVAGIGFPKETDIGAPLSETANSVGIVIYDGQ